LTAVVPVLSLGWPGVGQVHDQSGVQCNTLRLGEQANALPARPAVRKVPGSANESNLPVTERIEVLDRMCPPNSLSTITELTEPLNNSVPTKVVGTLLFSRSAIRLMSRKSQLATCSGRWRCCWTKNHSPWPQRQSPRWTISTRFCSPVDFPETALVYRKLGDEAGCNLGKPPARSTSEDRRESDSPRLGRTTKHRIRLNCACIEAVVSYLLGQPGMLRPAAGEPLQ